ncbi:MAG: KEOPS complex kinase/ATPase Bud32 [Promethearchaeota archaeon]
MSVVLAKGAEAMLFLEQWYGIRVVRKHRIPKSYRVESLDKRLRHERTIREARTINVAKRAGVPTPIIYSVNLETATIIMEYIEANRLMEHLETLSSSKQQKVFKQIGKSVALLHHTHICHGDLTTSNMLLHTSGKVYFIDFGLATTTHSIEDYGTDIHLLRRALNSTHHTSWRECFNAFKDGYQNEYGRGASRIFRQVEAIESRGRYITERIR